MSEFSSKPKTFTPSGHRPASHQLATRPFVVQRPAVQSKTDDGEATQDTLTTHRLQQLDAGMMQTLSLQAQRAIGAPGNQDTQAAENAAVQFVEPLHSPQAQPQTVPHQDHSEASEALPMQPLPATIQRQAALETDTRLQMPPLTRAIQRQDMEAAVEEEETYEEVEEETEETEEVDGETIAQDKGLDEAYWDYTPAKKPEEVLENEGYRSEHLDAKDVIDDLDTTLQQINSLKQKYDKEGEIAPADTVTEFSGQASAIRAAYQSVLGEVPSTDTREQLQKDWLEPNDYERRFDLLKDRWVYTSESQALYDRRKAAYDEEVQQVEAQIKAVAKKLNNLRKNAWDLRDEMQPIVSSLVEAEVDKHSDDFNDISLGFLPLLKDSQELEKYIESKDAHLSALENAASERKFKGDATAGKTVADARKAVANDAEMDANIALIGKTRRKVSTYIKVDYPSLYDKMVDFFWDNHASSVLSTPGFKKRVDDKLDEALDKFYDIEAEHIDRSDPYATDGQAFAAAVNSQIAFIQRIMNNAKAHYALLARSIEIHEHMVIEVANLITDQEAKKAEALPNIQQALTHLVTLRKLRAEEKTIKRNQTSLQGGSSIGSPSRFEAQQEALKDIPTQVAGTIGTQWFTYSADLEALKKEVAIGVKAGKYKAEDLKQAETQLKLAGLLNYYDNWFNLLQAAREKVLTREASPKRTADLKKLDDFEKRLTKSMNEDFKGALDPKGIKNLKGRLESISKDIKVFHAGEIEGSEIEKYIAKTVNAEFWKKVNKSDKKWMKRLGTLHKGVGKGLSGLDALLKAHTILKSGESVSLSRGASHPAIEGMSTALDAANTFNKVPIFKDLIGFYVKALGGISKQLAFIEQKTKQYKLEFATLTGEIDGEL